MRKTLDAIALVLLVFMWAITVNAVLGPGRLPDRIPTHFNLAGQPDGWGTPAMLWVMPVIATVIALLISLVARYPSAFNFSMRALPGARLKLESIALNMLSWLRVEVVCLFAWLQYETIHIVRLGQGRLSPAFMPFVLLAVFGTIGWHIAQMRRAARA
jgi:uncharacterized membrane protein